MPLSLNYASATDVGKKRSKNQDAIGAYPETGLFLVADGMGGHRGGETASLMAVDTIAQFIQQASETGENWNPRRLLTDAIQTANHEIYARSSQEPELHGMGTTTVSGLFKGDLLTLGHVGDSRCYLVRNDMIWQVTRDHSLVQEKIRAGLISRNEAKTDRMKNVITRSVGFESAVSVEIYEVEVRKGDTYLLCSDGLSGQLSDQDLLQIILNHKTDLNRCVEDLIRSANDNGGDDNISSILVEVKESP